MRETIADYGKLTILEMLRLLHIVQLLCRIEVGLAEFDDEVHRNMGNHRLKIYCQHQILCRNGGKDQARLQETLDQLE